MDVRESRRRSWAVAWGIAFAVTTAQTARSIPIDAGDLGQVERAHGGVIEHCEEAVAGGDFQEIFDCGDELFEAVFNAVDGVGANVGDGGRFTRVPRADRTGAGEWADHEPPRATGPNAASCVDCHQGAALGGGGDGSGPSALNVIRDPFASARPEEFIQRNTPHLFGPGALQRLAEEMSQTLRGQRERGIAEACRRGAPVAVSLSAKGVEFGRLRVDCAGGLDAAELAGVDPDLVVRPFQWKGIEPTVRSFSRGASHNELGMQPVELSGDGQDGDGDGVVDEITVADMTAMAVYLAAQPRPVTEVELNGLRLDLEKRGEHEQAVELGLPVLSRSVLETIREGERVFGEIGCADCHRPFLLIDDPRVAEPSRVAGFFDDPFPAGQPRLSQTIAFDLTRDLPDNQFSVGRTRFDLGNFRRTRTGEAIVRLYGDLKRHDMGPGLAENVDETGHGASVWITKELWGVGSTAQYLHDGRASTLTEAILEHGGEAQASRTAFAALPGRDRAKLIRFLENLVLFFPEEEEPAAATEPTQSDSRR
jgi:hypothetical protein